MRAWSMRSWIGILVYVAAYDTWAGWTGNKTLSTEFREYSRKHPLIMAGGTAYLVSHLFGAIPSKVDPLTRYPAAFTNIHKKHVTSKRPS